MESPNIVGRWRRFIRVHEKVGVIVVETEYKGKTKSYALKMFNSIKKPDNLNDIENAFIRYKDMEVKASYGLGEMSEYNGRINCSEAICWNLEPAGADPEPAEEVADIQRDKTDEIEDLPF